MKRTICIITGTRADYGILYPVMKAIEASKYLNLCIIATGMHLMKEFGFTVKEIKKDGFNVYKQINTSYKEDTGLALADSIGKAVSKLAETFAELKPNIVLVLGDRGEMLAAAIAANYLNIPVAHIHGGELSGHVDGLLRHAITKLAHIHFAATIRAEKRILRLGEEEWRVFISGAPALDNILRGKVASSNSLIEKFGAFAKQPFILVAQHPVNIESSDSAKQMQTTLEAVVLSKHPAIVVYPNADAGGRKMIGVIKKFERFPFIKSFKSVAHKDYLSLMRYASVLVGNSSSGIIEAPSLKLPFVNIGNRQNGRERGSNVINVPHKKNAIIRAINKALYDNRFRALVDKCKNPYGDGYASERIIKILSAIKLDKRLLQKQITY